MTTLYDSIDPNAFPTAGFDATAGYINGRWPSSAGILARFPHLPHLPITVTARGDAKCLDVEPGDATIDEAPAWLDRQYRRGEYRPVLYTSASQVTALRHATGDRPYLVWAAHYTGKAHICGPGTCGYPQADATQWFNKGPNGENVDQTFMSDVFYQVIGGQVAHPRTTWRGVTTCVRLADMLNAAMRILPAGAQVYATQGSYTTGVSASGNTHAGCGAVDLSRFRRDGREWTWNELVIIANAIREVGGIAWPREAIPNVWTRHVHVIGKGCPELSDTALQQERDYANARDGLKPRDSTGLSINPDNASGAYRNVVWENYQLTHSEDWLPLNDADKAFFLGPFASNLAEQIEGKLGHLYGVSGMAGAGDFTRQVMNVIRDGVALPVTVVPSSDTPTAQSEGAPAPGEEDIAPH